MLRLLRWSMWGIRYLLCKARVYFSHCRSVAGTGKFDAKKNVVHQSGTFACPMTGEKNAWYRSEWQIVDKNTNVFSMYTKAPNGKEFKSMEMTYKRVK